MSAVAPARSILRPALALGLRDLRGGIRGFGVFLACIALGVAAIAGVGSFARGLVDGLAREGRVILGADISYQLIHQEAAPDARAALAAQGTLATMATTRAMARIADGRSALVELKAVEPQLYPLVGRLETEPSGETPALLAERDGRVGVLVETALLARLDLAVGQSLILGDLMAEIRGVIRQEPDRLAGGVGFGPRVIMSLDAMRRTGLIQPGSLIRWLYQVKLPETATGDRAVEAAIADIRARFPEAGFEIRSRMNASPQLATQVRRFSQFLTLVGLTALLVGGVGVANAVARYVDRRRDDIATLKALGATGGVVFGAAVVTIGALTLMGVAIGLVGGALLPPAIGFLFGALIPVPIATDVYWSELFLALGYGVLVAAAFAIWPLGRAHDISVAALFRDTVGEARRLPRWRYVALTAAALGALVALSILVAFNQRLALMFMGAAAAVFVTLRLVGLLVMAAARRLPRPRSTGLRLAIGNIHRPGAMTPSVVLSLGLGLTLLVVIALIDASFQRQVSSALPERAPSFFFVDIANSEAPRFDAFIAEKAPGANLERVPMLRGRFVSFNGTPVENVAAPADMRWALSGDRGITYAAAVPKNSRVVEGDWWAADYSGPPLVSFDERLGKGFGLKLGDAVTVNVLGRNISARIANFRQIQWDSLGINFIVVFSPNTFRAAPHAHLATLTFPGGAGVDEEVALLRDVAAAFPAVTTVRVKDALEAVGQLAAQLAAGIRGASLVTLISAVLVLAGALAAGHRARVKDAVILETLGASRRLLIGAYMAEYAMIGLVTAGFAVAAGAAAAYAICAFVMNMPFVFAPEAAFGAAGLALALTVGFGLIGTLKALSEKPAPVLRHL